MHSSTRPILLFFVVSLLTVPPSSAFDYPLSETAARNAYFLGQRRDASMGEFLARYSKHLPAPKTGPYVSDVTFFTPYAQLVQYSSRQGMYSAQQAELDSQTKLNTVEVTVYIYLTDTYGAFIPVSSDSRSGVTGIMLRRSNFWREFKFRVLDGDDLREPTSIYPEPQYRCVEEGCLLIGSRIHMSLPAALFSSDRATVEITTPDDQHITADFNLAALR
jgi:hypothetical protein